MNLEAHVGLCFNKALRRLRRYLELAVFVFAQRLVVDQDLYFEPGDAFNDSHGSVVDPSRRIK